MDEAFLAFAERAYEPRRVAESAWLDARLIRATSGRAAIAATTRSMKRRCRAAREAVDEALRAHADSVGTTIAPADTAVIFDRLAGGDRGSCMNALAAAAGRFPDGPDALAAAEGAVAQAYLRGRQDALKHLMSDAQEFLERRRDRSRPLPAVVVRRGVGWLFGGGAIWSGIGWLSWHWPAISTHVAQLEHFLHH